jgi:hypothetical protein
MNLRIFVTKIYVPQNGARSLCFRHHFRILELTIPFRFPTNLSKLQNFQKSHFLHILGNNYQFKYANGYNVVATCEDSDTSCLKRQMNDVSLLGGGGRYLN